MRKPLLFQAFLRWVPVGVLATCLSGLVYLTAQQTIRLSADLLPVQLAGEAAHALESGASPADVVPDGTLDIAQSDAAFVTVYSVAGDVLASSAQLDGGTPSAPPGVLDYTRTHGEDRITWQPRPGVRSASALVAYGGAAPGVVQAGHSLREPERLIDVIGQLVALAWVATMVATFLATVAVAWVGP